MKKTLLFLSFVFAANTALAAQTQAPIWNNVKPVLKITAGTGFAGIAALTAFLAVALYPTKTSHNGIIDIDGLAAFFSIASAFGAISAVTASVMLINSGINDIKDLDTQAE